MKLFRYFYIMMITSVLAVQEVEFCVGSKRFLVSRGTQDYSRFYEISKENLKGYIESLCQYWSEGSIQICSDCLDSIQRSLSLLVVLNANADERQGMKQELLKSIESMYTLLQAFNSKESVYLENELQLVKESSDSLKVVDNYIKNDLMTNRKNLFKEIDKAVQILKVIEDLSNTQKCAHEVEAFHEIDVPFYCGYDQTLVIIPFILNADGKYKRIICKDDYEKRYSKGRYAL